MAEVRVMTMSGKHCMFSLEVLEEGRRAGDFYEVLRRLGLPRRKLMDQDGKFLGPEDLVLPGTTLCAKSPLGSVREQLEKSQIPIDTTPYPEGVALLGAGGHVIFKVPLPAGGLPAAQVISIVHLPCKLLHPESGVELEPDDLVLPGTRLKMKAVPVPGEWSFNLGSVNGPMYWPPELDMLLMGGCKQEAARKKRKTSDVQDTTSSH